MPKVKGQMKIRETRRKSGVVHMDFQDGKLTLWDDPLPGTVPVAFAVRDGHIAFQESLDG